MLIRSVTFTYALPPIRLPKENCNPRPWLVATQLIFMSSWYDWRGGFAIGPRNLILVVPLAIAIGVAGALRKKDKPRMNTTLPQRGVDERVASPSIPTSLLVGDTRGARKINTDGPE